MTAASPADKFALIDALDCARLEAIAEFLTLASKCAAAAALAAEDDDLSTLAVRTRQSIVATREAVLVISTLGTPEADL